MTTCYTAIIEDKEDLTFEEFALRCARGMSALIMMRDDPMDAEVPDHFPLDDYHSRNLENQAKKLLEIRAMTHEDIERRVETKVWYDKKQYDEALVKFEKHNAAYTRMLAKVEGWSPPSADHHGMKKFMIEQIKQSLPTHPSEYYHIVFDDPKKALVGLDHEAWRRSEMDHVLESMEYHQSGHKNAIKHNEERNAWLNKLKASIKGL
jgi:hypothetical protein